MSNFEVLITHLSRDRPKEGHLCQIFSNLGVNRKNYITLIKVSTISKVVKPSRVQKTNMYII